MKGRWRGAAGRILDAVSSTIRQVPISSCYHFRGYRYGGFGHNPYEDYICGLAAGENSAALRSHFAWLVLNCRARTMSEALQIDLPAQWPLWEYPWSRRPLRPVSRPLSARDNPDVMCHFSPEGVLASHINREFAWLEDAAASIGKHGYRPREYGYIRCFELSHGGGSHYVIEDGNHRISALHAQGQDRVDVQVLHLRRVRREYARRWRHVRGGNLSQDAALRIFDRYFQPSNPPPEVRHPARLLVDEPPAWPQEATTTPAVDKISQQQLP